MRTWSWTGTNATCVNAEVTSSYVVAASGLVIGVLYGLFGVGSAFATPVLSLIGIPAMAAVVGPLPALLPSSISGAMSYARHDNVDWWVAKRTVAAAFPAAIIGALVSRLVGSPSLVIISGVVLLLVGIRVLAPTPATGGRAPWAHEHPIKLSVAAGAIGFASGLLANGGGFLLVPLFLLSVGLSMSTATDTSLVVASTLTIPTLVTHALIGDINWNVSGLFALGLIPGASIGANLSRRIPAASLRNAFGLLLIVFATWFLGREVLAHTHLL